MDEIIKKIYEGIVYVSPTKKENYDHLSIYEKLYGEITMEGVENIIKYLKDKNLFSDIKFLDLGCGNGRSVYHMGLYNEVIKSTGVEIFNSKIEYGKTIFNKVVDFYPDKNKISLLSMDLFDYNDINSHNIVLFNNATDDIKKYDIIFSKLKVGAYVFSVFNLLSKELNYIEKINCSYSWSPNKKSKIFIYQKKS